MNHSFKTTLTIGIFALIGGGLAAQNGNDLFQQALVKERTDGNLTEVISLYERIVQQAGADRKLAAKALYQIGQAYEKLGQTEARKAYERIGREFADQKEVAEEAGRRLVALGGSSVPGRLTSSLVWKHRNAPMGGSVSRDGRYLSFVDWASGDLAVRDVVTGQERRIAEAKNTPKAYNTFAEESVISRDGQLVAYNWFEKSKGRPDLRIANLSGDPNPRRLYDDPNVSWLEPRDWSPDGKSISVLIGLKDRSDQIGLVSVADGSLRVLRSGDWPGDTRIFFSPDGKYLGYDLVQSDGKRRDVWVTATDGSGDTIAIAHPSNDVMMGWSPDGRRLLFRSDRTGAMAFWSLPISGGKPRGEPELIKPDVGEAESLGITQTGAMFYGIQVGRTDIIGSVEIGSFDVRTGAVVSARDVSDDPLEGNSAPCWSPDGKYLAYNSNRDGVRPAIVIRSAETNRVIRELPHKLRLGMGPGGLAGWEPNSRALLFSGRDGQGRWGVYRVSVESGAWDLLFEISQPQGSSQPRPQWSADGRSVYYHRKLPDGEGQVFVQREIISGTEKDIVRRPSLGGLHLSPDGSYIATESVDPSSNDRIVLLIPLRGGEPRELMREGLATDGIQSSVKFWMPDSRSLFVAKRRARAGIELWQLPVSGGSPRKLDSMLPANVLKFAIHPDGKTVAFRKEEPRSQSEVRSREVWVLENFLQ